MPPICTVSVHIDVYKRQSLSSVFVVTNALRLRLFKPKTSPATVEVPKHEEIKEDTIMKTVIKVNGMMCAHCKAHVETACKGVPGVTDAVVDLDAKNVTVNGTADLAALKLSLINICCKNATV